MINKLLPTLLGCLLPAAFSTHVMAADSGLYLAADVGQSHFNSSGQTPPAGWTQSSSYSSTSSRFTLGYQLTPYFGVEAGYVDLGHSTVTDSNPHPDPFQPLAATLTTTSIGAKGDFIAATGTWPINQQWSLLARVGVISSQTDYQYQSNGAVSIPTSVANSTNTAWEATYGLGAKWNVQSQLSLRLGWDHYNNLGNASVDVNLISLGVEWRFF